VLIDDSVTDIEVSLGVGVRSIGFAKTPERGDQLAEAGADAIVPTMTELATAVRADAAGLT
jgi:phosphoglycolate phosphatase-like HAD superfamily hydrolase